MNSSSTVAMMLIIVVLGIGSCLAVVILNDILRYRDLQRRLREEQRRREETGSR